MISFLLSVGGIALFGSFAFLRPDFFFKCLGVSNRNRIPRIRIRQKHRQNAKCGRIWSNHSITCHLSVSVPEKIRLPADRRILFIALLGAGFRRSSDFSRLPTYPVAAPAVAFGRKIGTRCAVQGARRP